MSHKVDFYFQTKDIQQICTYNHKIRLFTPNKVNKTARIAVDCHSHTPFSHFHIPAIL